MARRHAMHGHLATTTHPHENKKQNENENENENEREMNTNKLERWRRARSQKHRRTETHRTLTIISTYMLLKYSYCTLQHNYLPPPHKFLILKGGFVSSKKHLREILPLPLILPKLKLPFAFQFYQKFCVRKFGGTRQLSQFRAQGPTS
jgi:hypothetical protein